MMRNELLMNTLCAVEQVQLAFEHTLHTIEEINHRYKIVSDLKTKAQKRQQSFEAEILAAITTPTFTKITSRQKKRKKRRKIKQTNLKKPLPKMLTKSTSSENSGEKDSNQRSTEKLLESYGSKECSGKQSLEELELQELEESLNYNAESPSETDENFFTCQRRWCSSCQCTTFYFDVVS